MLDAGEAEALLSGALGAASGFERLDDALSALASVLSPHYPVSRMSVRVYDPVDDALVVDGLWTIGQTEIGLGTRLPARSTSFHEVERRGGAVLSRWLGSSADEASLLDRLMSDEGNRSWVVIPLRRARLLAGLLTVSAEDPEVFEDADLDVFEALGVAVGDRLLALAGRERPPS